MLVSLIYLSFLILTNSTGIKNKTNGKLKWSLKETWSGNNFFSKFNFYTGSDPTHGYVNYVSESTANSKGYTKVNSGSSVYIGCDHSNVASGSGRESVRLESNEKFAYGLFILSLSHMPEGCGTWPAYWMVGPNWPNGGEIDIIEGVDNQKTDQSTLHTSDGCNFDGRPTNFTGYWGTGSNGQPAANCYVNANGQYSNQGCGIISRDSTSYGTGLNNVGGGIYATQWEQSGIYIWYWNKNNIPANVKNQLQYNDPDTTTWGIPSAEWPFGSWCPSSKFNNQQIIFDLTFCGDWDGSVFGSDCPGKGSCNSYVQNNPSAFQQAYWDVEYIKIYQ